MGRETGEGLENEKVVRGNEVVEGDRGRNDEKEKRKWEKEVKGQEIEQRKERKSELEKGRMGASKQEREGME
jgi:hypothetical protein